MASQKTTIDNVTNLTIVAQEKRSIINITLSDKTKKQIILNHDTSYFVCYFKDREL